MKGKRCMRQGCRLYVVEAVSERKGPSLDQYTVFLEFKEVFLNDYQGYLLIGRLILLLR
jgi:hypothetical protein